ncbi:pep-cterm sorting domain-containing protein [Anaeramoeba flamelloides]|uniref:Pep-cterm sorting domain-containing protein n=1 Tax=Anaeramoeba flamelloides TaxID=1746091 RepID=A0ABQ8X1S0_9EUKA|nr:pep-cterm sorting domain-containing protein [Anaeramoeba flamelloides]
MAELDDLSKILYEDKTMVNAEFHVGENGEVVYGHKLIFALGSSFWRRVFYPKSWQQSTKQVYKVTLPDLNIDTFKMIKKYIYIHQIDYSRIGNVFEFLEVLIRFEFHSLIDLIEKKILQDLNSKNCLLLMDKCINYHALTNLRNESLVYFISNMEQIFSTKGCLNDLSDSTVIYLLSYLPTNISKALILQRLFDRGKKLSERIKIKPTIENATFLVAHLIPLVEREQNYILNEQEQNKITLSGSTNNLNHSSKLNNTSQNKNNNNNTDNNNQNNVHQKNQSNNKNMNNSDYFGIETQSIESNGTNCNGNSNKKIQNLYPSLQLAISFFSKHTTIRSRKCNQNGSLEQLNILMMTTEANASLHEDVIRSIKFTGIKNVQVMNVAEIQPNYDQLIQFDSIFLFSSIEPFSDSVILGNLLAAYVEDGGGLVVCSYRALIENAWKYKKAELKGRIIAGKFLPIAKGSLIKEQRGHLGSILNKTHELVKGVKQFNGGSLSYRIKTQLEDSIPIINEQRWNLSISSTEMNKNTNINTNKSTSIHTNVNTDTSIDTNMELNEKNLKNNQNSQQSLYKKNMCICENIAVWNDGTPLISVKQIHPKYGKVVVLNMWPVSGEIGTRKSRYAYWLPSTNGNLIIANSVEYTAKM